MFNQRNLSLGRGDDGTVLCVLHLWIQSIMDRNYLEENNLGTGEGGSAAGGAWGLPWSLTARV